jgi:hypothetical protein
VLVFLVRLPPLNLNKTLLLVPVQPYVNTSISTNIFTAVHQVSTMVFPFGVSVSDFIAGVKLFKDAIDSLSDTRGARADFAELSRSLTSLERALKALGEVRLDTDQHMQALKQNLDACKLCLETFLVDIAKFRELDVQHVTKARLGMMFRQIRWALCKRDDVKKFRSEIETHIGALEMLLITFQV